MKAKKVRKYVEKVGTALLGIVMPCKQEGVTRKEAAALAYGASMGIGIGYGMATGELSERTMEIEPRAFAALLMNNFISDWPEERERYLSLGSDPDARVAGVYAFDSKQ